MYTRDDECNVARGRMSAWDPIKRENPPSCSSSMNSLAADLQADLLVCYVVEYVVDDELRRGAREDVRAGPDSMLRHGLRENPLCVSSSMNSLAEVLPADAT